MKTIWKYPLEITDVQEIEVPRGSTILSIHTQYGVPCVWVLVPNTEVGSIEKIAILTFGTGNPVNDCGGCDFLGTYLTREDHLVFHVFYKYED